MAGWARGSLASTVQSGTNRESQVTGIGPLTREVMVVQMRVNRTLLYTGVFLAAIGGAVMVADFSGISTPSLIDVLRLWPVAVIVIGFAIALRRTQLSLASGLLAAAVPGLVLGGAMTVGPRLAIERGYWDAFKAVYERHYQCPEFDTSVDFGNVHIDPSGGCR